MGWENPLREFYFFVGGRIEKGEILMLGGFRYARPDGNIEAEEPRGGPMNEEKEF